MSDIGAPKRIIRVEPEPVKIPIKEPVNMPAARNRVEDLRRKDWVIDSKHQCQDANHAHDTRQIEYRLIAEPGQLRLG
ncbi:hypothetical protein LCGC14_0984430 [marine sediment metagenome]|uniref:Uncharacterized protein n=1 Tax=marine sediment metagenome TaxID=412755 RepID=A0A0F9RE90_9ZZZZ